MIAATSDWHWGDGTASDCACYTGAQAILDATLGTVEALVLCGDWLDAWRSSRAAVLVYQERRLRRLAQRLRDTATPLYWVLGNHDDGDPGEWARALAPYELTSPILTVCNPALELGGWMLLHGHRWDRWNATTSPLFGLAHGLTRGSAWVKTNVWPGLDESSLDPSKWIEGARSVAAKRVLRSAAANWAAEQRVHVCYGHTHDLGEVQGDDVSGGFHAVNCGCASRGRAAYVRLGADGQATLHPLMGSF